MVFAGSRSLVPFAVLSIVGLVACAKSESGPGPSAAPGTDQTSSTSSTSDVGTDALCAKILDYAREEIEGPDNKDATPEQKKKMLDDTSKECLSDMGEAKVKYPADYNACASCIMGTTARSEVKAKCETPCKTLDKEMDKK
jgi:hypothetical protein